MSPMTSNLNLLAESNIQATQGILSNIPLSSSYTPDKEIANNILIKGDQSKNENVLRIDTSLASEQNLTGSKYCLKSHVVCTFLFKTC